MTPAWINCPCCENYLCTIHGIHAHDCECPPIEEWEVDPYSGGGMLRMLDLFAGLGGASAAMKERGWEVITVDNDPLFKTDILADITTWNWDGTFIDLVWASPPCEEFSRESMPWCKTGVDPSMALVESTVKLINQINPRFWIIENTRGAVKWFEPLLGPPAWVSNPIYLWGEFPPLPKMTLKMGKEKLSSTQAAERAKIPYKLSEAVAISIEGAFNFAGTGGTE